MQVEETYIYQHASTMYIITGQVCGVLEVLLMPKCPLFWKSVYYLYPKMSTCSLMLRCRLAMHDAQINIASSPGALDERMVQRIRYYTYSRSIILLLMSKP
jgi:hypothetical protein